MGAKESPLSRMLSSSWVRVALLRLCTVLMVVTELSLSCLVVAGLVSFSSCDVFVGCWRQGLGLI